MFTKILNGDKSIINIVSIVKCNNHTPYQIPNVLQLAPD